MPADMEPAGWMAAALGAMGLGSGGGLLRLFTTQSAHAARLDRLERDRQASDSKLDETHTTVTRVDTKVEGIQADVTAIREAIERHGRGEG